MKRWDRKQRIYVEDPKVDSFINELVDVCKRHGFSLGHEDDHGSFLIHGVNEENFEWLRAASVES